MKRATHSAAIENHYTKNWGPPLRRERLTRGPVHELPPGFEVLVFQRNEALCYATSSMSQPLDDEALELHLMAEHAHPGLVEFLTVVAHSHRTGHRLGLGHSVNFGRPWLVGATASFGLISLPYLDGPDLEWSAEPRIRFLWLLPITESEREFKKAHGTEALEQRFEEAQLDYLNPRRASVV